MNTTEHHHKVSFNYFNPSLNTSIGIEKIELAVHFYGFKKMALTGP